MKSYVEFGDFDLIFKTNVKFPSSTQKSACMRNVLGTSWRIAPNLHGYLKIDRMKSWKHVGFRDHGLLV